MASLFYAYALSYLIMLSFHSMASMYYCDLIDTLL
jgi:hypothetical protein